ncbi:MAG: LicD family protein [Lachnospiraceae bacterium]|nr:LicD family protein [Lachnospiraceae bacterium]
MLQFEPSYFNAEDRDGFHIKSMVKRCWAVQLKVLSEIDAICKRHNIMYYAECGTLLGAVRHGGFIPWDDDLDIGMRRVDYTRFLHYAKTELPEGYSIINVKGNGIQLICRVVNTLFITMNPKQLEEFYGFPYIGGIDIFITDNIPKNKNEENVQLELLAAVNSLAINWDKKFSNTQSDNLDVESVENASMEEKMELVKQIEELCNIKLDPNKSMKRQLLILSDQICAMYWDDEPNEVSLMPDLVLKREFRFPVSYYASTIDMPFENTTIPVPKEYDKILRKRYGDNYMTPIQCTSSHNYPFYCHQEKRLFAEFEKQNLPIPAYLKE